MQMVANIRKYKGMNAVPKAGKAKSIKGWNDWKDITPVYTDYRGETEKRDHPSAVTNPQIHYTNNTGRNDFTTLKVARDRKMIYFLAETASPVIKSDDEQWMRLYINSDRNHTTGWMGYDFRINAGRDLQQYIDGEWKTIGKVTLKMEGNRLMYSFPLKAIFGDKKGLDFEFKWSDNMQKEDPMEWYIHGDVAPEGRFNYVYQTF